MWIELHQSLVQHKKMDRLVRETGLGRDTALGRLCMLWLWALANRSDGDLSDLTPGRAGEILYLQAKQAGSFLAALERCGFLDREGERLLVHDWEDYAGRLLEARARDRERKRRDRAARRGANAPQPQRDCHGDAPGLPLACHGEERSDVAIRTPSASPAAPVGADAPVGPLLDPHSASGGAVGAAISRPPSPAAAAAQPQRGCHGEPVTVSLVWPSASPAPPAPLIPPPAGEVASGVSRPPDDGRGPLPPASSAPKGTDRHDQCAQKVNCPAGAREAGLGHWSRDDRAGEGSGRLIAAPTPDPPAATIPDPGPSPSSGPGGQLPPLGEGRAAPSASSASPVGADALGGPPPSVPHDARETDRHASVATLARDDKEGEASPAPTPAAPIPHSEFRIPNSRASSADPIAADAARTRDYLRDRGLDAEAWLGSTPALQARSEALARDLFQCFADRSPTLADRAKLLPLVTVAAGAERRWDEDRADLLRYAFEQAALSGAGGSWPYIEGVLQRLRQRGIETLEQAEDYEWGREA